MKAVADAAAEKRMAGKGVKMSCEGITDLMDEKHEELSKGERGTPIYCMKFKDLKAALNSQTVYA